MKTNPLTLLCAACSIAFFLNTPYGWAQNGTPEATPGTTPESTSEHVHKSHSDHSKLSDAERAQRKEQFRQKMSEYLKKSLNVSDEEWAILQPLIEKVKTKKMATFGTREDSNSSAPALPVQDASSALAAAVASENSSPEEIKARLEALRAARKKAGEELDQAREELRGVLTLRQEAQLVMQRILE